MGVRDVVFHKKRGLSIESMVKSRWVYRKLRNFRAGIEANISCLKRALGGSFSTATTFVKPAPCRSAKGQAQGLAGLNDSARLLVRSSRGAGAKRIFSLTCASRW